MSRLLLHFDGLCQPLNPYGIACYGFVAREAGITLHAEHGLAAEPFSEEATNNVAEYVGLIRTLEWLLKHRPDDPATVRGDSKMVVDQVTGTARIRSEQLKPYAEQARALAQRLPDLTLEWVPREHNEEADALTERAYLEALHREPVFLQRAQAFLATPQEIGALERRGLPVKPFMSRMDFFRLITKTKEK